MVFNATFNNISAISWRSVLFVVVTEVPGENHQSAAYHWQTLSHNVVSSRSRLSEIRTILVGISTDYISSCNPTTMRSRQPLIVNIYIEYQIVKKIVNSLLCVVSQFSRISWTISNRKIYNTANICHHTLTKMLYIEFIFWLNYKLDWLSKEIHRFMMLKIFHRLQGSWLLNISLISLSGRLGLDRMIVGFTTTYAISAYHH